MERGGEEGALTALAAPHDGRPRPRAAGASETHTLASYGVNAKSQSEEKRHDFDECQKVA